jgi:hypothetical protein
MEAPYAGESCVDSLDRVEQLMSLEEEFGIEISENDWPHGAPVPRHGPRPTLSGGAEAIPPIDVTPETDMKE